MSSANDLSGFLQFVFVAIGYMVLNYLIQNKVKMGCSPFCDMNLLHKYNEIEKSQNLLVLIQIITGKVTKR